MQLTKAYNHKNVESKWYAHWINSGAFRPSKGKGPTFSMVIPPPNVTGSLHMGHALNNALQDILCRYKRMNGHRVLWVPGTDHAGIATQDVVERHLAAQGLSRSQLGRDEFIARVWEWKKEAGNTILLQLKALGVSCDWEHERFTMDEGVFLAVREAFVRLWEDGLLYRAQRFGAIEIYLPLADMINLDERRARLTKEAGKVGEELARIQKKLCNPDFIVKAKEEVVQKEREKSMQYEEKLRTLNLSLERLREIE
jgi:valyl-tRNA synthetase